MHKEEFRSVSAGRPMRSGHQGAGFAEIFARIKVALGVRSQADVARSLSIGRAAVSDAKARGSIPADWFLKLAREPHCINPSWLETGEGEMVLRAEGTLCHTPVDEAGPAVPSGYARIPLVEPVLDGGLRLEVVYKDCPDDWVFRAEWLGRYGSPKDMCMVRMTGDAMLPTLVDGDMALVNLASRNLQEGRVHLVRLDSSFLIRRLGKKPGKLVLINDHRQVYEPVDVDIQTDDIEILGSVVWIGRSLI